MERSMMQHDSQMPFSFVQKAVNLFCAVVLLMASTVTQAVAQQAPPQIVVDNSAHGLHPELDKTQNGIDQINIVSPNGAGVSHNMFRNYNVSERGIILNNATHNTQTKIGGVILGNTNLHGRAAATILNEVTGPLPSHILGYTEVAGKQAAVIIANPNGLTCNGCGFINTSRVTLTTGHPEFNAQGGVQAFAVSGGTVQFGQRGADFATVPVLDILSRSVKIEGPVSAQKANLVLGRNHVVYGTNEATPLADDKSKKPELALDTAAMGGLYANSIYLIVNESGAGVRVDGTMAANAGDMHLDSRGNLVLNGRMLAQGQVNVRADGDIQTSKQSSLESGQSLSVAAGKTITNDGVIYAYGGRLHMSADGAITNTGHAITNAGPLTVHAQGHLANSGELGAQQGAVSLEGTGLSNDGGKLIAASGPLDLKLHGGDISNRNGLIQSSDTLTLTAGDITNQGGSLLSSGGDVSLTAGRFHNEGGLVQAQGQLDAQLGSYASSEGSSLVAGRELHLTSPGAVQNEGVLASFGKLTLDAARLTGGAKAQLQGQSVEAKLGSGGLQNGGSLIGLSGLSLTSTGSLANSGELGAQQGAVSLEGTGLSNDGGKLIAASGPLDMKLHGGDISNRNGLIQSSDTLTLTAGDIANQGGSLLSSKGDVSLTAGRFRNEGGLVQAQGQLDATLGSYASSEGSSLVAGHELHLTSPGAVQNEGVLASLGRLDLSATQLNNGTKAQLQGQSVEAHLGAGGLENDGSLIGLSGLTVIGSGLLDNHGEMGAQQGAVSLESVGLNNDGGKLIATAGPLELMKLHGGDISNQNGLIQSSEGLTLVAGNLFNQGGSLLSSKGDVSLTAGRFQNEGGLVQAQGNLNATLGSYASDGASVLSSRGHLAAQVLGDVHNSGLMGGGAGVDVHAASLENDEQAMLVSVGGPLDVNLAGQDGLKNAGTVQTQLLSGQNSGADMRITAPALLDTGIITSAGGMFVTAGKVTNQGGALQAGNGMTFNNVDEFYNNGGTVLNHQGSLILNATRLRNESGRIESAGDLMGSLGRYSSDGMARLVAQQVMILSLSGELSNNGLLGGGTGLTVSAASIQNGKQGHLLSDQGDVNLKTVQGGIENQGIVEKRNASGQLLLSAPFVRNEGTLLSAGIVALDKVQDVVNASTIYGARGLTGQIAGTFENSNGLFVVGGQEAHIEAARVINEAGSIRAVEGGLTLQAGQIDNRGGQIDAVADVQLQSDFLANQNGLIQATGNLALGRHDAQIENSQGTLQAGHDVAITAAHLANDNGKVLALGGDLTVNNAVAASDAKMADGRATALDNEAGILQAARAVALGLSALKDDAHSIITASKYLSLSGIAPLTVNGLMLGGEGVSLQSSGLSVTPAGQIISSNGQLLLGLDGNNLNNQGLIQAQGQDARLVVQATGSVMNSGTLLSTGSMGLESQNQLINGGTLGTLGGDLAIQAQNLNNQGKIVSSGWLDSTITGDVHNVGQMYGQKGQTLSGGNIANQKGEISAQGDLTLQGQSLTNDDGHIISDAGNVTAHIADSASSHGGLVQGLGNVIITSGTFDNSQRGIILSKQGAVQLSAAHQSDNRGGTIQAARDVQLTALSLDNSGGGLINAVSGGVDVTASGGDGMDTLHNEGGTIQANGDLHLAAQHLSNADGKILQQSDDYGLSIDDGVGKLTDVAVGSAGIIQTKGSLSLAVNSLHGFGTLIAPKDLNVTTYTPDTDTFFQASRDATVTILGDYNIATGAGVLAGRNAIVQAASIRNDGALMANGGILTVHSGRDVYNTGLLYGATGLVTTLPGTLTNYKGAVLTGNGGMVLSGPNGGAMSSLLNQSGQITATGSDSDIDIAANRLTNDIVGGVARKDTGEKRVWYYARGEWRSKGNPARIPIPVGFLDAKGEQATGTLIMSLLSTYVGKHRGEAEVTKKEIYSVANNAAPLLSAGRDIHVSATGGLLNDGGHIAAGRDMALSGAALQNVGYTDERIFKIGCLDHRGCGWKTEGGTVPSFKHTDGRLGKTKRAKAFTWGTFYLPGLSGTIAAGGNITGSFTGSITNQTKLAGDLEAVQGVQFSGKRPDGLRRQSSGSNFFVAAASSQDKSGGLPQLQPDKAPPVMVTASQAQPLSLPGFSGTTVSVSASNVSVAKWKPADTPVSGSLAAGGISVPVGRTGALPSSATVHQVDGSTLPGQSAPSMSAGGRPAGGGVSKNTSGNAGLYVPATSLHAVVASIPASGTLFVPNPSPSVHYLLETNPRYATFAGLYGSDYLLGRLGHSMGDYRFLGDSGFDTQYVQQQIVSATGQTFLGGSYQTANEQMQTLLDNASRQSDQLGLTFGRDLTADEQSRLTDNIVWYVPVSVNGQTVLVPKLYLAPGKVKLANGGVISVGGDLSLQGGSLSNSGAITSGKALNLVATQGDLVNDGGSLSGGDVTLASLAGSIVNDSQLRTSRIAGGTQQDLQQQGAITASGNARLSAAKDLLFKGASLKAGEDATLVAGQNIDLDALSAHGAGGVSMHHFTQTGSFVRNIGSSVMGDGTVTLAALGGDISLAGSGVVAGKNAFLQAKGNLALKAVTDEDHSYSRIVKKGFLTKKTITISNDSTTEIGSLVGANDNVLMNAGGDLSTKGTVSGGQDTTLTAGGALSIDALKDTTASYYQKKKSGFSFHIGTRTSVGYGKSRDTDTGNGTSWTSSAVSAGKGDLTLKSQNRTTLTGSTSSAGHDISFDASSVVFKAVEQSLKQTQDSMSSYYGVSGGLTGDSVLGSVVQSALAASQAKGKGSTVLRTFNAMQGAYQLGTGLSDAINTGFSKMFSFPKVSQSSSGSQSDGSSSSSGGGGSLVGVSVSFDMSKTKSHSEQEQSTVLGSTATAGNRLSIVARGEHPEQADDGAISATAAQLAAKDITLEAKKTIDLEAGWNRQSALNHTTQKGLSVGVEASVGTSGAGISLSASGQMQRTNMESHQATAADTVLNATNSVSLTSGGKTTLKGAEVTAPRIDVKAAELEITSPQNTSDYRSTAMQATAGVKIPLYGAATGGASASYQNQKTTDHFASTGKVLSGLYAGDQGIGIDVSGNTSLTAGVISSTASREKNHFNTGSLEAHSLENSSAWQSQSVGFQAGAGSGMITGSLSQTLVGIGKGMAANSAGLLGGGRSHDESSESQSAISDNITVNAGHVTGSYSRDVAHANGALTNKFDAQKLQNQIQASQLGTQLVGEIVGTAFQKIQDQQMKAQWNRGELSTVPGPFSALEIGRDLLEAGGAAGVAALTGGNVAAAGVGTLSGNVMAAVTRDWTDSVATSLTGNSTGKLHDSLANLFSGIIAAAGGTVGGLIAGGGDASVDALTGAAAAAAIEQYNADAHKKVWTKKEIDQMREAFLAQDNIPDDQAMILWNSHEQTDAQYAKTVGMPKRAELEKYAREQGVNIEVVMGTIAAESGVDVARGRKVHDGSVQGLGQFANAAFDDSWESLEKRKSPVVSTLIPREKGGKQDPWTTGVLAIETLRNAALQLRKMGIANPTFAEARALYIYGPSGGRDLAKAISRGLNKTMGEVVKNHDHLFNNRTPPDVTVKDFLMHLATGKSGVGRNVINAPILMEGK